MTSSLPAERHPPSASLLEKEHLLHILKLRDSIYKNIRRFFALRDYIEVETPVVVPSPGIDPYIDAMSVEGGMYLATSPELQMKRLLGMGMQKIFQFTRAFRKGEQGKLHNPEFSLLEWYHTGVDYWYLMDEAEALIRDAAQVARDQGLGRLDFAPGPFPRHTVDELFQTHAGWIPSQCWNEERFFLDLVDKIEPIISLASAAILYDFPAPVASLARLKPCAPHLCERFEIYLAGLEVANAFSELTDPHEQRDRFAKAQKRREDMGKDPHPVDVKFLYTLEQGLLPPCAGIAMGLDRLIMAITGERCIDRVMAFPSPL